MVGAALGTTGDAGGGSCVVVVPAGVIVTSAWASPLTAHAPTAIITPAPVVAVMNLARATTNRQWVRLMEYPFLIGERSAPFCGRARY
jgi:hypothetical protein